MLPWGKHKRVSLMFCLFSHLLMDLSDDSLGESVLCFFPSAMWVTETKLKPSSLAARAFTLLANDYHKRNICLLECLTLILWGNLLLLKWLLYALHISYLVWIVLQHIETLTDNLSSYSVKQEIGDIYIKDSPTMGCKPNMAYCLLWKDPSSEHI